jgi:threonine/homoserine/homoserine lactone efflux protein
VAWISIFAWVGGMALVWYGRRQVDSAVRRRRQELADAAKVDLD